MAVTVTIRELRNQFPKVKKLVEQESEVIVTDQGTPRYRLTPYTPTEPGTRPAPKDYMGRLSRHQPRALGAASAASLHDANRGDR